jgi:hypothetical protein
VGEERGDVGEERWESLVKPAHRPLDIAIVSKALLQV